MESRNTLQLYALSFRRSIIPLSKSFSSVPGSFLQLSHVIFVLSLVKFLFVWPHPVFYYLLTLIWHFYHLSVMEKRDRADLHLTWRSVALPNWDCGMWRQGLFKPSSVFWSKMAPKSHQWLNWSGPASSWEEDASKEKRYSVYWYWCSTYMFTYNIPQGSF